MEVCIHRGAQEIGGSCVELRHEAYSLVLDLGLPLDAPGPDAAPMPAVAGFASPSRCAVALSHGHPDHHGLIGRAPEGVAVHAGAATRRILSEARFFTPLGGDLGSGGELEHRRPFRHGPFTVTPYLVDHSAFDSYSLLVEVGGRRLLYSGDLRATGRKRALFERFLGEPPRDIDVLLLEGTRIGAGRPAAPQVTEQDVEERCVELFTHTPGIVLVCYSAQNIDRLVSLHRAARRSGRRLVLDLYAAEIARATGRPHTIPQAAWGSVHTFVPLSQRVRVKESCEFDRVRRVRSRRLYPEDLASRKTGLVLTFRSSMVREIATAECLDGAAAVWSMWPGYLERPRGEKLRAWFDEHAIPLSLAHASGHASPGDLRRYAAAVDARQVVPVHTGHPESFAAEMANVRVREDGEWWRI